MTTLAPLTAYFAESDALRVGRTKEHHLLDRIGSASCAGICGADGWVASAEFGKAKQGWRPQLLALPKWIPSPDTFGRVFAPIDLTQCQPSATGCKWCLRPVRDRAWRWRASRGSMPRSGGKATGRCR